MKLRRFPLTLAVVVLLVAGAPTNTQAQTSPSFVTSLNVTAETVTFQTEGAYEDFTLIVSGPNDFRLERHFAGTETPSLPIATARGDTLAVGTYTMQVTARPKIPQDKRAALEHARATGNRRLLHRLLTEAGIHPSQMVYATEIGVTGGRFLDPGLGEEPSTPIAEPARDAAPDAQAETPVLGSVTLTGRRWDAAYLPNASDVTRTAGQPAALIASSQEALPFVQAAPDATAAWYEASFQNTAEDGTSITYQGFLRPVMADSRGQLFEVYLRQADGGVVGPWHQGYFQADEGVFRASHTAQAPQPFDYLTDDTPDETAESMAFFHIGSGSIDGSLCVGNDCPANPAFGFDTLRLQENNLRLHYDDTSVAAAFPNNDWRILINASTNGGASFYGIQDATSNRTVFRVDAEAPTNAIRVRSTGRVGLGTSTPAVELQITDGNTPTMRLEQDGSSGFTPQTWDVAGNETNFFIRDATSGSTLPLRIRPGASTSMIDISGDDEVGIGTGSPDAVLHIQKAGSGAQPDLLISNDDGGAIGTGVELRIEDVNPQMQLFETDVSQTFTFLSNGGNMQFREGSNTLMTLFSSTGAVNVTNELTAGTKTFHIDHPLDPENKFLNHVSIESPDMMNVYNGNITTNAQGEAVVELPDYFEALNQDYRYQLTVIGTFAQAMVAEEIRDNRFVIQTDEPGVKVSWQVTGIRHDPFAVQHRVQVEVDKPAALRGRYLHPTEYNQPMERSIYYDPLEVKEVNQGGGQ